jgi:dTDP-4-dehydrorhamnose reductase
MTAVGATHWAGFAEAIFQASAALGGPRAKVLPITSADYPTSARRPANSRLDCAKLARAHGVTLPTWQAGVAECVARVLAESRAGQPKE